MDFSGGEIGRAEAEIGEHFREIEPAEGIGRRAHPFDPQNRFRIFCRDLCHHVTVEINKLFFHEQTEIDPHGAQIFFAGLNERIGTDFIPAFIVFTIFFIHLIQRAVDFFQIGAEAFLTGNAKTVFFVVLIEIAEGAFFTVTVQVALSPDESVAVTVALPVFFAV